MRKRNDQAGEGRIAGMTAGVEEGAWNQLIQ